MPNKRRLILASQSPRRAELLQQAGFDFDVSPTQISEIPDENLNLPDQVRDIARQKAIACLRSGKLAKGPANLLLAADTVVILSDQILGKPRDRSENARYLRRLSGQWHDVITAVCMIDTGSPGSALEHSLSRVRFRDLKENEIEAYVNTDEGLDKAGGYGIQGPAGKFVDEIIGDFDTIVGLPISLVTALLEQNDWTVDRR